MFLHASRIDKLLVLSVTDDNLSNEDAKLVLFSITALVNVAEVYPSIIKKDLHACIMHIFILVFGTPTCQASVVPQILPVFKSFLSSIAISPNEETSTQFHSLITQLSHVMKVAQRREFSSALQCEKNAMLGLTIVLTAASGFLSSDSWVVRRVINDFMDCLGHGLTTKVAAGCCRSLLVQQQHKDEFTEGIALLLLPRLIDFFLHPPDVEGLAETEVIVGQILSSFVSALQTDTQKRTGIAVIMPVFLDKAQADGPPGFPEASKRLLELASASPSSFRNVAGSLDTEMKQALEKILVSGREHQKSQSQARSASGLGEQEPTIALKTDFAM